jgi:hypothetical protein
MEGELSFERWSKRPVKIGGDVCGSGLSGMLAERTAILSADDD